MVVLSLGLWTLRADSLSTALPSPVKPPLAAFYQDQSLPLSPLFPTTKFRPSPQLFIHLSIYVSFHFLLLLPTVSLPMCSCEMHVNSCQVAFFPPPSQPHREHFMNCILKECQETLITQAQSSNSIAAVIQTSSHLHRFLPFCFT